MCVAQVEPRRGHQVGHGVGALGDVEVERAGGQPEVEHRHLGCLSLGRCRSQQPHQHRCRQHALTHLLNPPSAPHTPQQRERQQQHQPCCPRLAAHRAAAAAVEIEPAGVRAAVAITTLVIRAALLALLVVSLVQRVGVVGQLLLAIRGAAAVGVPLEGIGLAAVLDAVIVPVLALALVPLSVLVLVHPAVGQPVAVGVRVLGIGLARVNLTVAVLVLDLVLDPVAVSVLVRAGALFLLVIRLLQRIRAVHQLLGAVAAAAAVGVPDQRIGLARVHHAVIVLVLALALVPLAVVVLVGPAVLEPVLVRVRVQRIGLAGVPLAVLVLVLHPVLDAVVVGVRILPVGLARVLFAVAVLVLDVVRQAVLVPVALFVALVVGGLEGIGLVLLLLVAVADAAAVGVVLERIGLARVQHAVVVPVLALARVPLAVLVQIDPAVGEPVAVRVRVEPVGLTRVLLAVAVLVLELVQDAVAVGVLVLAALGGQVIRLFQRIGLVRQLLFAVGSAAIVGVLVEGIGLAGVHGAVVVAVLALTHVPLAVFVFVGPAVLEPVLVRVRIHPVGLLGVPLAVAVLVLQLVRDLVVVRVGVLEVRDLVAVGVLGALEDVLDAVLVLVAPVGRGAVGLEVAADAGAGAVGRLGADGWAGAVVLHVDTGPGRAADDRQLAVTADLQHLHEDPPAAAAAARPVGVVIAHVQPVGALGADHLAVGCLGDAQQQAAAAAAARLTVEVELGIEELAQLAVGVDHACAHQLQPADEDDAAAAPTVAAVAVVAVARAARAAEHQVGQQRVGHRRAAVAAHVPGVVAKPRAAALAALAGAAAAATAGVGAVAAAAAVGRVGPPRGILVEVGRGDALALLAVLAGGHGLGRLGPVERGAPGGERALVDIGATPEAAADGRDLAAVIDQPVDQEGDDAAGLAVPGFGDDAGRLGHGDRGVLGHQHRLGVVGVKGVDHGVNQGQRGAADGQHPRQLVATHLAAGQVDRGLAAQRSSGQRVARALVQHDQVLGLDPAHRVNRDGGGADGHVGGHLGVAVDHLVGRGDVERSVVSVANTKVVLGSVCRRAAEQHGTEHDRHQHPTLWADLNTRHVFLPREGLPDLHVRR